MYNNLGSRLGSATNFDADGKKSKHVRPNGGFLDGDESHGMIRKKNHQTNKSKKKQQAKRKPDSLPTINFHGQTVSFWECQIIIFHRLPFPAPRIYPPKLKNTI